MLVNLPLNLYHIMFPMVSPATAAISFHCRTIDSFDHLSGARKTINFLGSVCVFFLWTFKKGISFPTGSTHKHFTAFAACYRGILHELVVAVFQASEKILLMLFLVGNGMCALLASILQI